MDDTAAIYNIMPRIKRTSSALDKIPPLFYPFGNKAEYV